MSVGAIILAAGFGTRLAPLTDHTPKPLLVVGDQPVASHLVERLRELAALTHVVVVVNDQHLDQWHSWQTDLPDRPAIQIVSNGVTTNNDRLGAIADLGLAARHLNDTGSPLDWVVVLAGDNLLDESLQPHVDAAWAAGHSVILCRDLGRDVPPGRFGEITIDNEGIVTRFREKPADPESPLAATCSYILSVEDIARLPEFLASGGNPDSPGEFIGWLANHQPVQARPITGRYHDIGNHETLAEARAFYRPEHLGYSS